MDTMTDVEKLFKVFDDSATILQQQCSYAYLEALAETGENLFQQNVSQPVDELHKKKLKNIYDEINVGELPGEAIRKAFQLAVLKGMREATQPHHEMTPDAVALFISYLVNKFTEGQKAISLLDPAVGTGNLLTAILNSGEKTVESFGVDADDLLLRLAFVSANLQGHGADFFHQDSIKPLLLDPVDLVVCDLPVGYYTDDETASEYKLKTQEGHSFAHHLLMEQSINHTKEGGFLIFLIPNDLFQSDGAKALNHFIKEQAVIQGLIQLPLTMFKKERHAKSIFMLQKKGEGVTAPSQALLADLPSFKKKEALQNMVNRIDGWFRKEFQ
jgi:site-specific DNA-methyltransferase (adenine-specific)